MKLTNLFKKAATVLCALALVGMLAACSNGSSGSSSDNNGSGNGSGSGSGSGNGNSSGNGGGSGSSLTGDYKLMYDDILIQDDWPEEYINYTKAMLTVTTDYTMSGTTMTLTDSGFAKVLPAMGQSEGKIYVAIVAYQKRMIMPVTQAEYDMAASKLTEGTDYTVTHNDKVIELTDAGYAKGAALFGGSHGSGNDDDDDDGEQVMGGFNLMYDDILLLEKGSQSNFDELKAEFPSNSYTVKDKTVTLNDTGLSKFLEYYAKKAKSPKPYVAIIVYEKRMLMPVTQAEYDMAASKLTEGTDYTVTHNDKVIELTDSGYVNGASLFRN